MTPIPVYIGYDPRESIAYQVLCHSIQERASRPVAITPIALHQLRDVFNRPRDPLQSTDFSFTRFLTPFLSGYRGWSIFMDCDMLMLDDISKLWSLRDPLYSVMVVQHDHRPTYSRKFLDEPQTAYPRKNWSSVMLFNNNYCGGLTPKYINEASGLDLHQFRWSMNRSDGSSSIGGLPKRWNHLVDYDEPDNDAALLHFTNGGPWFKEYSRCGYSELWLAEYARLVTQTRI